MIFFFVLLDKVPLLYCYDNYNRNPKRKKNTDILKSKILVFIEKTWYRKNPITYNRKNFIMNKIIII